MPPSAITGHVLLVPRPRPPSAYGRNLRHADAGHHARGADRARTNAHFDRIHPGVDQGLGTFTGGDVATDDLQIRIGLFHPFDAIEYALGVTMRGIHHDDVDAGFDQCRNALFGLTAGADAGAHAQLTF